MEEGGKKEIAMMVPVVSRSLFNHGSGPKSRAPGLMDGPGGGAV